MAVTFKISSHTVLPGIEIVQILIDGMVVGVIYPGPTPKSIRLVSAHMSEQTKEEDFAGEVVFDDGTQHFPPIPALFIEFEPSPYRIEGRKIIKEPRH